MYKTVLFQIYQCELTPIQYIDRCVYTHPHPSFVQKEGMQTTTEIEQVCLTSKS
jgi:hypothetical protein